MTPEPGPRAQRNIPGAGLFQEPVDIPFWPTFVSILLGLVGMALVGYGKKQGRAPQIIGGVALMAFPYFVSSLAAMLAIAVALIGLIALAVKLGL